MGSLDNNEDAVDNDSNNQVDQHTTGPMNLDDDANVDSENEPHQPINPPNNEDDRRHQTLLVNWQQGRFKRITCPIPTNVMVTCLQLDGDKFIASTEDGTIGIYKSKTGRHLSTLRGHEGGVWALQFIGNTLVTGSTDRTVRVWDMERAVCTHVFSGHASTIRSLKIVMPAMVDGQLQPAQPLIVSGSRDCTLRVWRLPDPKTDPPFDGKEGVANPWHIHTLTGHADSVRAIAAHGNTLVSGSYDHIVIVWNLETGRPVHRLTGHTTNVYTVIIDPKRKRCYSSCLNGSIHVWDYVTGVCLQELQGHTALVGHLGLTTNDLISAGADGVLRVWDLETGMCRYVLSGHKNAISCFHHDEHKIISGSEGGLKMWDIKTGRHIQDLNSDQVDWVWKVVFDKRRCVAAVSKNYTASFELLDFGVYDLEE